RGPSPMPRLKILAVGLLTLALVAAVPAGFAAAVEPGHAAVEPGHGGPAHAGGHAGDPDPMEVQPSLAIWTVIVFLALFGVLAKFAWKPLLAALHQREEHLEHVLVETERARNESEQLLAQHRKQMDE